MRHWCIALLLGWPSLVVADLAGGRAARRRHGRHHPRSCDGALGHRAIVGTALSNQPTSSFTSKRPCSCRAGMSGATRFVTSRGGYRLLRVTLSARLRNDESTIMLGHELQHATELAEAPVHDIEAIERLPKCTGYRTGSNVFETASARRTEKMIRLELSAAHRTRAAPVSDASAARSAHWTSKAETAETPIASTGGQRRERRALGAGSSRGHRHRRPAALCSCCSVRRQ